MYELGDTITALSSSSEKAIRYIVRLSGTKAVIAANSFLSKPIKADNTVVENVLVFDGLEFDAAVYSFAEGKSYTGDELVEIHINCPFCVVEPLIAALCRIDKVRLAGAGEFTTRAYFNGKLDLAQAEAVAQIVSGSNAFQIQAAVRLLEGKLSQKVTALREQILELLSLIEAGLDFSEEDITFITPQQAAKQVSDITHALTELLANNIRYERMLGLPAVAIAGCPNAGKSSLLNALLGKQRSIVSSTRATTRDVITEVLELKKCSCVISDCAGIEDDAVNEIDHIAQKAALEALNQANLVLFCVDISKDDFSKELRLFDAIDNEIIALATKSDKLDCKLIEKNLITLEQLFGKKFTCVSISGINSIEIVKKFIEKEAAKHYGSADDALAVNRRHYESIEQALVSTRTGLDEFSTGGEEIAAMYLRAAYESLSCLNEYKSVDESILDKIFSNFCIGK